jgi:hypothetical protein
MGSVSRRLARLEEQARDTTEDEEGVISRDALRRVTNEDLRLVHAYLKRKIEEDGKPTEEEEAALVRYQALREEVRNERAQTA